MSNDKHNAAYHDGNWPGDDHGQFRDTHGQPGDGQHGYPAQDGYLHTQTSFPPKEEKKHRKLPWIVGGILGLALIGQLGDDEAPATPEPTPVAPTTEATTQPTTEPIEPIEEGEDPVGQLPDDVRDNLYTTFVRSEAPLLESVPDATLLQFGEDVCSAYDAGATLEDVSMLIVQEANGDEEKMSAFAVASGAAVPAFCPEHNDKLEN